MLVRSFVTFLYRLTSGSCGVENSTVPTQRQAHEMLSRCCLDHWLALSKLSLTQLSWSAKRWSARWESPSSDSKRYFLSKIAW